jgi:hypothetical protein
LIAATSVRVVLYTWSTKQAGVEVDDFEALAGHLVEIDDGIAQRGVTDRFIHWRDVLIERVGTRIPAVLVLEAGFLSGRYAIPPTPTAPPKGAAWVPNHELPGIRNMKTLLSLLLVTLLTACATPMKARSDYDSRADFSRLHSFAWIAEDPLITPEGSAERVSPLNRRRIVEAIESELIRKGFRKEADASAADFVLSYTVGARDRISVQSYPVRYRGYWGWGGTYVGHDASVSTYREGTLAIDIFDTHSNQPVWHGWATRRFTERDVENAATLIPVAVDAILADFPPRR